MEVHDDAGVAALQRLLLVGLAKEGQRRAIRAKGRLDDIRNDLLARGRVEVFHALAGGRLVRLQVEIRAVSHAPELAPAEREEVFKVRRRLGVMRQLLRLVVAQAQVLVLDAQTFEPLVAVGAPVAEPLQIRARHAEELQLHLLELADAEDEVARRDLVAEALADLADAERQLAAGRAGDVREVDEDALRGLRAQIDLVARILGHALMGLEHHVELADAGEIVLAAGRTGNLLLLDEAFELLVRPAVRLDLLTVGLRPVLDQLIRAEARLAGLAIHQRVVEVADVAARHPNLTVHQNRAVDADVVLVLLHELLPPRALDVVLELNAQRAVIPRVGQTAVDFGAGEHEAAALAQGDELIHRVVLHLCHGKTLLSLVFRSQIKNREDAAPNPRRRLDSRDERHSSAVPPLLTCVKSMPTFDCSFCARRSGLPTPSTRFAPL